MCSRGGQNEQDTTISVLTNLMRRTISPTGSHLRTMTIMKTLEYLGVRWKHGGGLETRRRPILVLRLEEAVAALLECTRVLYVCRHAQ